MRSVVVRPAPPHAAAARSNATPPATGSIATVAVNVLPTPSVDSTVTSPPLRRAKPRDSASPSPVPPNRRVTNASACVNGWNSRPACSRLIPMPVSDTDTANSCRPACTRTARSRHRGR